MPTWKFFLSDGLVRSVYEYGGIKEIRHYATGSKLGWEMGNGIAAIHIQKKYEGDISFSFSEVYK